MTPTRISKIARLPVAIRNELNTRLQNGEIGRTLLKWLNNLPETKTVLADLFNSKPITHQNLSEWRRAGYQDWLMHQQRIQWFKNLTEEESEIIKSDHCNDTFEAMSNYFIFELGQAITSLQTIKNSPERLDRLESLTREFARLQNAFNWSRRVQLEWCKHNGTPEPQDNIGGARVPSSPEPLGAPASRRREDETMQIEAPEQEVIEIQAESGASAAIELTTPERQRAGALQDAPRSSAAQEERASVLDCASPLPPSDSNSQTPTSDLRHPASDFQPIPTPAPATPPTYCPPARTLNSQTPKLFNSQTRPPRGRRFVCIEG